MIDFTIVRCAYVHQSQAHLNHDGCCASPVVCRACLTTFRILADYDVTFSFLNDQCLARLGCNVCLPKTSQNRLLWELMLVSNLTSFARRSSGELPQTDMALPDMAKAVVWVLPLDRRSARIIIQHLFIMTCPRRIPRTHLSHTPSRLQNV